MQIAKAQLIVWENTGFAGIELGVIYVTFCQRIVLCLAPKSLTDAEFESYYINLLGRENFLRCHNIKDVA